MRFQKYDGYTDDMKYKEGVLTLLEKILGEVRIMNSKVLEPVIEEVKQTEMAKELITETIKKATPKKTKKKGDA